MYQSEDSYTEKIDKLIQEQMLVALEHAADQCEVAVPGITEKLKGNTGLNDEEKQRFFKELRDLEFIPPCCTPDGAEAAFRELFVIISSNDMWIPSLMGEYVLAHALDDYALDIEGCIQEGSFRSVLLTPDERKVVKDELIKELVSETSGPDDLAQLGGIEGIESWAEDVISGIEHADGIEEICFHDRDYAFLDEYTPEELILNGMDSNLGIGVGEPARCWGRNRWDEGGSAAADTDTVTVTIKEIS